MPRDVETDPLPWLEDQREAHDAACEQPDQSDWVTCVLPPKGSEPENGKHCRWATAPIQPAADDPEGDPRRRMLARRESVHRLRPFADRLT